MRIKQKTLGLKVLKNFRKIFRELSVSYLKTNLEYYLNKFSTVIVLDLSQVYLSKHAKI